MQFRKKRDAVVKETTNISRSKCILYAQESTAGMISYKAYLAFINSNVGDLQ